MRLFTTIIFSISLLVSLKGNCQRDMEDNRRWLNRQLSKHSNLVVLNNKGFKEFSNIVNNYTPQSFVLGYFVKDSFFIYHREESAGTNESCTGVMGDRVDLFEDSVKPYCKYAEYQFIKKGNFLNYNPDKSEGQTLVILFTRSHIILNNKFYKDVAKYCRKRQMPYILLFSDFALDEND